MKPDFGDIRYGILYIAVYMVYTKLYINLLIGVEIVGVGIGFYTDANVQKLIF